jgi:CO dehydrogenase maturation factor
LSFAIAVAGKGGSGKTTTSALIIRYLLRHGHTPILAVDADANANLGESLGMKVSSTVGGMLATFQGDKISIPAGMTKEAYLEYRLNEVIVESKGLDLLTMGRGEGADCYCYPNTVLRKFTDSLSGNYKYVVMDNEAGMEHLSRGTTQNIDHLFIISNPTVKGVRTVARIKELLKELKLVVKSQSVVITSVPGKLDPMVEAEMSRLEIVPSLLIPQDEEIARFDLNMKPLTELPDTAKSVKAVDGLLDKILPKVKAASQEI